MSFSSDQAFFRGASEVTVSHYDAQVEIFTEGVGRYQEPLGCKSLDVAGTSQHFVHCVEMSFLLADHLTGVLLD